MKEIKPKICPRCPLKSDSHMLRDTISVHLGLSKCQKDAVTVTYFKGQLAQVLSYYAVLALCQL